MYILYIKQVISLVVRWLQNDDEIWAAAVQPPDFHAGFLTPARLWTTLIRGALQRSDSRPWTQRHVV